MTGFITRGRGVTVHNTDCPHLERVDRERLVEVEWETAKDEVHPVRIQVTSTGRAGTLADVAGVMKQHKVNILEADLRTTEDSHGVSHFLIQVHDAKQLDKMLREINRLKGVRSVKREGVPGA